MSELKPIYRIIVIISVLIAVIGLFYFLKTSSGVLTYLLLTVEGVLCILLGRNLHLLGRQLKHHELKGAFYWNILLGFCSVMLVLTLFETYLQFQHRNAAVDSPERLTMPDEWKLRNVEIEGAKGANYWHGKLHVYNEAGMRWSTPFPAKQPDVCRIMVVGDSLTYGKGVGAEETYPAVMEAELSKLYRVEVLNLGRSGYQSEEILETILTYTPQLRPDIIVYGVCLNDFLETGEGQGTRERRQNWPFPLPLSFKQFMIQQTLSGEFFEKRYDDLLMRFGLRADFFSNILKNLHGYQIRFTRDVTAMNYFVISHRLPPVVAMVLDQAPVANGRGHKVARIAESIMTLVGMDVIIMEGYYTVYDGRVMKVSPWEGHPSAEAHKTFAEYLVRGLVNHPVLEQYRK